MLHSLENLLAARPGKQPAAMAMSAEPPSNDADQGHRVSRASGHCFCPGSQRMLVGTTLISQVLASVSSGIMLLTSQAVTVPIGRMPGIHGKSRGFKLCHCIAVGTVNSTLEPESGS